jgi:hypothetical protein
MREKEAELGAARRWAMEVEELVRQAAAESQAWLGVTRTNEAIAMRDELRGAGLCEEDNDGNEWGRIRTPN